MIPKTRVIGVVLAACLVIAVCTSVNTSEPTAPPDGADRAPTMNARAIKVLAEGYNCLGPRYGVQIDQAEVRELFTSVETPVSTVSTLESAGILFLDLTGDCHDHADMLEELIIEDGEDPKVHLERLADAIERANSR